jgi:diguanylate cyclase (GGDEF)-like protein
MSIRIRTKILISFTSILLLLSLLGFIAYYNRDVLFKSIRNMELEVNELMFLSGLQLAVDMAVMPPNDYLITGEAKEREKFREILERVELGLERLEGIEAHREHAGLLEGARERFLLLKEKAAEIFAIEEPIGDARGARLMREVDALSHEIVMDYLGRYHEIEEEEIATEIAFAEAAKKRTDTLIVIGAAVSVLTAVMLMLYLTRSILRPILLFREGAFIIGSGDLDHKIDLRDGVEMNLLADEFNRMTERLKASYAHLERKVEERTRELVETNARLEELSITDGLTGAYNHRHFYQRLDSEIKRAERYGLPLSLIMADIDYFKAYNDANGHLEGDRVLKGVASCITENVRGQDIVARYGGEEFSVILPETGKAEAAMLAERLRRSVSEKPFPREETQPDGDLTISSGVACFPDDATDPKGLIKKADQALYRAKDRGRNRVEAV